MSGKQHAAKMQLNLAALARKSATPPRTIRFYIAKGLLPGPAKAGRGAFYGPEHLQRLAEIQQWQRQGLTLTEIGHKLAGQGTASAAFVGQAPTTWHCFQLQEDLVVQLRADASPWRRRQLQNLLNEIAARMAQSTEENDDESQ